MRVIRVLDFFCYRCYGVCLVFISCCTAQPIQFAWARKLERHRSTTCLGRRGCVGCYHRACGCRGDGGGMGGEMTASDRPPSVVLSASVTWGVSDGAVSAGARAEQRSVPRVVYSMHQRPLHLMLSRLQRLLFITGAYYPDSKRTSLCSFEMDVSMADQVRIQKQERIRLHPSSSGSDVRRSLQAKWHDGGLFSADHQSKKNEKKRSKKCCILNQTVTCMAFVATTGPSQ